jgi:hypothetical protein
MIRYTINDGHTVYTRISKRDAKRRFDASDMSVVKGYVLVSDVPATL